VVRAAKLLNTALRRNVLVHQIETGLHVPNLTRWRIVKRLPLDKLYRY
jgi:hypothetical protein